MLRNKFQLRRRQKPASQPVYRIENETNPEAAAQYFQVTVNVREARKLTWTNIHSAESYVIVIVGKKKKRTNIKRNMEEPHYGECFLFELYTSIRNIKRTNVWLAVMEPRFCSPPRLLGETNVDLSTVWTQPHHQVFNKWAQLSLSRDPTAGVVGLLKVDITIRFRDYLHIMHPIEINDKVDKNLLLLSGSEEQRANYLITIYCGFGLTTPSLAANDRYYGKPPSAFVRVTFCGLTAKTAVQQRDNNPIFCERVSIIEMFPNMNQFVYLELYSGDSCQNKAIAGVSLNLPQISHDGDNGFIPTFGPSLLHMYGTSSPSSLATNIEDGAFHRGALLISLKTIVPYYNQSIRTTNVEPVTPINLENLWTLEDFCIICPILEVSMLDRQVVGKYSGVAISIADMPNRETGDEEFLSMINDIRSRKLHYTGSMDVVKIHTMYGYLHFANSFPVLQLATRLPDFRFRIYRNNMIYGIVADLEHILDLVEKRYKNLDYSTPNELFKELNKALDATAATILKFLDVYSRKTGTDYDNVTKKYNTELDEKQMTLQKEDIEKIYQHISKKRKRDLSIKMTESITTIKSNNITKKEVKLLIAETKEFVQNFKSLVFEVPNGWPDIIVWLLNNGSRVAYAKVPAAGIIYSTIPEENGRHCGRIQTITMKPLKCLKQMHSPNTGCFCIVGKIELSLWMGLYKQLSAFETFLPNGYKIKIKDCVMSLKAATVMVECRAFIYKAKLSNIIDSSNLQYTFLRINTLNAVKESKVKQNTLTPIWNQVLKINKIIYTSQERLIQSPPDVIVEVCSSDSSGKIELIGRIQLRPVVDDRQDYEFAPKLHWYELYKGREYAGRLLMSVQILQIPETLLRSTNYGTVEETYYVADIQGQDCDNIESLPDTLIPQFTSYKIDVYWWGLRDVNITTKPGVVLEIEELAVKSDIIIDKKRNCNFPNGRITHIFDAPLEEAYSPSLTIRLYDQSTFGRTLFLGTNVVKNPNKYIVYWYSRNERELALKSASIKSANCNEAMPLKLVKSNKKHNEQKELNKPKVKRSRWNKLFSQQEPNEEEYALLPIFTKENDEIKITRKCEDSDWWMRFFTSEKAIDDDNCADAKITIYNTELETQPEFSKFKDWCKTFKLYNGTKTGIPEKDERLHFGYLKAGVAIYKWPPPQDSIAVNRSGVDLQQGYFNNHPSNDSSKFLIRVYIVKGVDLLAKDFTGKLDPYCVISCGKNRMGDRDYHIRNTANPVFGKMYEFGCNLPDDYLLSVSLYNHNVMSADELIGSTTIDLEDRIYTKHRARVGLSFLYHAAGPLKWRDCIKPSAILEELCSLNHIPPPTYTNTNTIIVNGIEYKYNNRHNTSCQTSSDIKEGLCLSLLHNWHTLPICGYHLVPEHVETRSLYNPEKRCVEQGKLLMWVDIFSLDNGSYIPVPVDITPHKMEDYELRLIIWNVRVQRLGDAYRSGKKHADIYVKAWIGNEQGAQYTDVHYQSKSGEGSFNWRMIFHFHYQHASSKMHLKIRNIMTPFLHHLKLVKKEKGPFNESEELDSPIVVIQVLESRSSSQDDFIAFLELDLNEMPEGVNSTEQYTKECGKTEKINLFSIKAIRAWWPLFSLGRKTESNVKVGLIDLEMSLLPSKKAIFFPVGLGRDPPQPLPQPRRSDAERSKRFPLMESLSRHGGVEYAVIGIILIITLTILCLYLDIPRTVLDYILD